MSTPPFRVDVNASRLPSGEYFGRPSVAGCVISRCAWPPRAGTTQMSPPETKAISELSGEMLGSAYDGSGSAGAGAGVVAGSAIENSSGSVSRARLDIATGVGEGPQYAYPDRSVRSGIRFRHGRVG